MVIEITYMVKNKAIDPTIDREILAHYSVIREKRKRIFTKTYV